jgi:hypothetical protein
MLWITVTYSQVAITWLNEFRSSTSLSACDNFHCPNYAHLEASLVEVVHVVVVYAVLGFSLLYQLKPLAEYLWILL